MARMAANLVLALAVHQNARSSAKDLPLDVRPQLHCMRRCLAASSRASMSEDYHVTFQAGGRRRRLRRPAGTFGVSRFRWPRPVQHAPDQPRRDWRSPQRRVSGVVRDTTHVLAGSRKPQGTPKSQSIRESESLAPRPREDFVFQDGGQALIGRRTIMQLEVPSHAHHLQRDSFGTSFRVWMRWKAAWL
jgi:hypothetical protein